MHAQRDELRQMLEDDQAVIRSAQQCTIPEQSFTDAQGRQRILRTIKIPYAVPGTSEPAVLGVAVDVTELKHVENELRTARDELECRVHQRTAELAAANELLKQEIVIRKRVEDEVKDTHALYSSLVENLPVHVLRKDLAGRFTFGNQSFCQLVGKSLEELIGKTDFDFYPRDLAQKYRNDDIHVAATRRVAGDGRRIRARRFAAAHAGDEVRRPRRDRPHGRNSGDLLGCDRPEGCARGAAQQ